MSASDHAASDRRAWNAGRKIGAKRALKPRQVWAIRFFLDQHCRLRDRALFDFAIGSKRRGCDVVRSKIGDLVIRGQYAAGPLSCSRRQAGLSSSRCWRTHEQAYLRGWSGGAGQWETMSFQAVSSTRIISASGSPPGSSTDGSQALALVGRSMVPTRCAAPKRQLSTRQLATCAQCRSCSGLARIESTVRYPGADVEDALPLAEGTEF